MVEASALDEFHGEIGAAVEFADFIDGDDVGMIEMRDRLGFDTKPAESVGVGGLVEQDHLEGDFAIQANLPRQVDDPHAAAGNLAKDFVIIDSFERPDG